MREPWKPILKLRRKGSPGHVNLVPKHIATGSRKRRRRRRGRRGRRGNPPSHARREVRRGGLICSKEDSPQEGSVGSRSVLPSGVTRSGGRQGRDAEECEVGSGAAGDEPIAVDGAGGVARRRLEEVGGDRGANAGLGSGRARVLHGRKQPQGTTKRRPGNRTVSCYPPPRRLRPSLARCLIRSDRLSDPARWISNTIIYLKTN